jgi:hypothetical protein
LGKEKGEQMKYDPLVKPDSPEWLALDESERIQIVEDYHSEKRISLPSAKLHAIIHSVVENQLAEKDSPVTSQTLDRLMSEGLDRHDAIHAIGSVLATQLFSITRDDQTDGFDQSRFDAELTALNAKTWIEEAQE